MPSTATTSGKAATSSGSTSTRTFQPFTSETAHLPAYSPDTPESYRLRLAKIRALREQLSFSPSNYYSYGYGYPYGYPYGFGYPYGYGYGYGYGMIPWGDYWGASLFLNSGFCDSSMFWPRSPYGYLMPFGYGFSSSSYLFSSPFFFSPFDTSLLPLGSPFGCGYPYQGNMFFNTQFSSLAFSSYCPLCTLNGPDFATFAVDNPFLFSLATPLPTPAGSPLSASSAAAASSTGNASLVGGLFGSATTTSASNGTAATVESGKLSPPRPISLIFKSGSTVQARDYWLADGSFHYVTIDGVGHTVPLGRLDMRATMKANSQNGLRFLPSTSQPQEHQP